MNGDAGSAHPEQDPEQDPALSQAIEVAVEALEERITAARWLLEDHTMRGLADPEKVRRALGRDELAVEVLRATVV